MDRHVTACLINHYLNLSFPPPSYKIIKKKVSKKRYFEILLKLHINEFSQDSYPPPSSYLQLFLLSFFISYHPFLQRKIKKMLA